MKNGVKKLIAVSILALATIDFSVPALASVDVTQGNVLNQVDGKYGANLQNVTGATVNTDFTNATITNTQTNSVLNWNSLNTAPNQSLNYIMTDGQTSLNNVTGVGLSTFAGKLNADHGRVIISNPNGIIFENGSYTNVNALILTTHGAALNNDELKLLETNKNATIQIGGVGTSSNPVVMQIAKDLNIVSNNINVDNANILAGNSQLVTSDGVTFYSVNNTTSPMYFDKNNAVINNNNLTNNGNINVKNSQIAVRDNVKGTISIVSRGDVNVKDSTLKGNVQVDALKRNVVTNSITNTTSTSNIKETTTYENVADKETFWDKVATLFQGVIPASVINGKTVKVVDTTKTNTTTNYDVLSARGNVSFQNVGGMNKVDIIASNIALENVALENLNVVADTIKQASYTRDDVTTDVITKEANEFIVTDSSSSTVSGDNKPNYNKNDRHNNEYGKGHRHNHDCIAEHKDDRMNHEFKEGQFAPEHQGEYGHRHNGEHNYKNNNDIHNNYIVENKNNIIKNDKFDNNKINTKYNDKHFNGHQGQDQFNNDHRTHGEKSQQQTLVAKDGYFNVDTVTPVTTSTTAVGQAVQTATSTTEGNITLTYVLANNHIDLSTKGNVKVGGWSQFKSIKAAAADLEFNNTKLVNGNIQATGGVNITKSWNFDEGEIVNTTINAGNYIQANGINAQNANLTAPQVCMSESIIKDSVLKSTGEYGLNDRLNVYAYRSLIENSVLEAKNDVQVWSSAVKDSVITATKDVKLNGALLDNTTANGRYGFLDYANVTNGSDLTFDIVTGDTYETNAVVSDLTLKDSKLTSKYTNINLYNANIDNGTLVTAIGKDVNIDTEHNIKLAGASIGGNLNITRAKDIVISNSNKDGNLSIPDMATGDKITDYDKTKYTNDYFEAIKGNYGNDYGRNSELSYIKGNVNILNSDNSLIINSIIGGNLTVDNIAGEANLVTSLVEGNYSPIREAIQNTSVYESFVNGNFTTAFHSQVNPPVVDPVNPTEPVNPNPPVVNPVNPNTGNNTGKGNNTSVNTNTNNVIANNNQSNDSSNYSDDVNKQKYGSRVNTVFGRRFSPRGFAADDDEINQRKIELKRGGVKVNNNSIEITKGFYAN